MLKGKQEVKMKRRHMLGLLGAAVITVGFLGATPASAQSLVDLRASGAVGEAFDGYARARQSSANGYVENVNAERKKIYIKRAKSQGVPVGQVGRVYATQIKKKAAAGTWLLSESGSWSQK
jgi:uncharacterized protein